MTALLWCLTLLLRTFQLVRVEPAAYRVFFEDQGHLDMLYDVQQMMAQLEGVESGAGVEGCVRGSVDGWSAGHAMREEQMRSELPMQMH